MVAAVRVPVSKVRSNWAWETVRAACAMSAGVNPSLADASAALSAFASARAR